MADAQPIPRNSRFKDLTNKVFGRWTVLSFRRTTSDKPAWLCRCECGTEKVVRAIYLIDGRSQSCGCFQRECVSEQFATHRKTGSPEHRTWKSMIGRCCNPKNPKYPDYGGRGIRVCDCWRESFQAFFDDMGRRPSGHTLDRIDNDGNYEPSNCRWAVLAEQANNKRTNHFLEYDGKRMSIADWSRHVGIPKAVINDRINRYKWSVEKSLTTPSRGTKN